MKKAGPLGRPRPGPIRVSPERARSAPTPQIHGKWLGLVRFEQQPAEGIPRENRDDQGCAKDYIDGRITSLPKLFDNPVVQSIRTVARTRPVGVSSWAISSGVPAPTMRPPSSPAPGPRSMIQSA